METTLILFSAVYLYQFLQDWVSKGTAITATEYSACALTVAIMGSISLPWAIVFAMLYLLRVIDDITEPPKV